jgi:hypothetical protein
MKGNCDFFEEITPSLPSHTIKERDTRGQKSRSDYQIQPELFDIAAVLR